VQVFSLTINAPVIAASGVHLSTQPSCLRGPAVMVILDIGRNVLYLRRRKTYR
jgi:hypothetical protein